mmetsp:Transcript_37332/g.66574  ORF Transcript_37332/g.66574 Transcript_37332/m.66574 type:complete len:81 (-) Transcript_37332:128-370(-)
MESACPLGAFWLLELLELLEPNTNKTYFSGKRSPYGSMCIPRMYSTFIVCGVHHPLAFTGRRLGLVVHIFHLSAIHSTSK